MGVGHEMARDRALSYVVSFLTSASHSLSPPSNGKEGAGGGGGGTMHNCSSNDSRGGGGGGVSLTSASGAEVLRRFENVRFHNVMCPFPVAAGARPGRVAGEVPSGMAGGRGAEGGGEGRGGGGGVGLEVVVSPKHHRHTYASALLLFFQVPGEGAREGRREGGREGRAGGRDGESGRCF